MNQRDNPAQFALTEEVLTDGSCVYGIRFFDDYDPDLEIRLDCVDRKSAEALLNALQESVCNVEVHEQQEAACCAAPGGNYFWRRWAGCS